MGKTDWASVSLSSSLMAKLDESLKSDKIKELGVSSRSQIITLLIKKFLDKEIDLESKSVTKNMIREVVNKEIKLHMDKIQNEIMKEKMKISPLFEADATEKEKNYAIDLLENREPPLSEILPKELAKTMKKIKKQEE